MQPYKGPLRLNIMVFYPEHPKRDDKHPRPFHMGVPPPGDLIQCSMSLKKFKVSKSDKMTFLLVFYVLLMSFCSSRKLPPSIVLLCSRLRELILVSDQFSNFRGGRLPELRLHCTIINAVNIFYQFLIV